MKVFVTCIRNSKNVAFHVHSIFFNKEDANTNALELWPTEYFDNDLVIIMEMQYERARYLYDTGFSLGSL